MSRINCPPFVSITKGWYNEEMQNHKEAVTMPPQSPGHRQLQDPPTEQGEERTESDQLLDNLSRVTNTEEFFKTLLDQGFTPRQVFDMINRIPERILCKVDLSRETLLTVPATPQNTPVDLSFTNGTTWKTITAQQHKQLLRKGYLHVQLWTKHPVRVEKMSYIPETGPISSPRSGERTNVSENNINVVDKDTNGDQ